MSGRLRWRDVSIAIAAAFAIKAALVASTLGTNDILSWQGFLDKISSAGGIRLYREVPLFNHPPFMIRLLQLWGLADTFLQIPLATSLRLTSVLADIGTAWFMWKLAGIKALGINPLTLVIAVLSPVSILIAGFHGNTDPLMMFLTVAAVYAAETRRSPWLIGVCLGAAMNIKLVPIILLPVLVFWLDGIRNRIAFVTAAGATFIAGSLPYIAQEPMLILARVFGYTGLQGQWGWSFVPRFVAGRMGLLSAFTALLTLERICLLCAIVALGVWMNRGATKPRPFLQCGFVLFAFLAAAPGWGVQYLDWLVVWTLALSPAPAAIFHIVSGVFLFTTYQFWAGGFPWYLADSTRFSRRPLLVVLLGQITWVVIVLLLPKFHNLLQQNRLSRAQHEEKSRLEREKMTKKAEYLLVSFRQEC